MAIQIQIHDNLFTYVLLLYFNLYTMFLRYAILVCVSVRCVIGLLDYYLIWSDLIQAIQSHSMSRISGSVGGGAENARLENAGLENSGTGNVWNATCGIS